MLTKAKIDKALDAFYWGDTGPNAKDEYTSGYKLLHKDEETINLVGEVLHTFCLECSCRKYLKEKKDEI